ncbi:hypothetical protein AB205_0201360, partial [Aquarana catesbeiana]
VALHFNVHLVFVIQDSGLKDDLNIILFSDHGMTDIFWMDKVIELQNYIDFNDILQMKDRGPVVSLWPVEGKLSKSKETLPFWNNGTLPKQGWQHGWHGYDNELMDMRGFFLASGPEFRSKSISKSDTRLSPIYPQIVMNKILW